MNSRALPPPDTTPEAGMGTALSGLGVWPAFSVLIAGRLLLLGLGCSMIFPSMGREVVHRMPRR